LHVLELRLLLVRPTHRAGELVAVLLDGQGGGPLLPADLVLQLPRPDRVRLLVPRAREAAQPEHQCRREDRLHGRPRKVTGGRVVRRGPPPAADGDCTDRPRAGIPSMPWTGDKCPRSSAAG